MNILDFTKRRLRSFAENGKRIEKCPKCGRKGTIRRYKDGSGLCVHSGKYEGGFLMIVQDFCKFKLETPTS